MKIGDYVGKWIITKIHKDRANDGHLLVDAKCSLCGFIKSRTLVGILRYSSGNTCNHFDKKCDWKSRRLANIYQTMIDRCYNKNSKDYKHYGDRGILVCNEWLVSSQLFNDWAVENGYTDELTIDRIDFDGDYCPENCRWITKNENSKWKSTTVTIELFGIVDSLSGWSKRIGFHRNYLCKHRSKYGMVSCINLIKEIMHP